MANNNVGCTTPIPDVSAIRDHYVLVAITYVSMTLNLLFLILLVIKLFWTVLRTCQVVWLTQLNSLQQQISFIVADEFVNTSLILFTVYTCISLCWPKDYLDAIQDPPTSLLCIVCMNLGRYLFRSGLLIHCQLSQPGTFLKLIHHSMAIFLFTVILITRRSWWFAVIAVIMEMNSIIGTMHKLMKLINKSHWELVSLKFSIVEFIAMIVFRLLLPVTLLFIYVFNDAVRNTPNADLLNIGGVWIACIFFSGFQFYQLYIQGLTIAKLRKRKHSECEVKPQKGISRQVLINSQNIKLNMVCPVRGGPLGPPGVHLAANLENKLKVVKNNLNSPKTGKSNNSVLLLNKTSNLNTDVTDKNSKNCDKVLIGHNNQTCTDHTELLNEVN